MSDRTKNFMLFIVIAIALGLVNQSLRLGMNDWRFWTLIVIVFVSFNYGRELRNEP